VNEKHLAMMVNIMVIRYMSPRQSVLLIIRHQGSKRPDRVVGPIHRREHASGGTAGVRGQVTVLLRYNSVLHSVYQRINVSESAVNTEYYVRQSRARQSCSFLKTITVL
jgi:hypothetical protein